MAQWNQGRLGRSVTGSPWPMSLSTRKRPAVSQRPSVDQSSPVPIRGDIMQARRLSQSPTALAQSGHTINQALSRQSAITSAFSQMNTFGRDNGAAAQALHQWASPNRFMDAPPRIPVPGPQPRRNLIAQGASSMDNRPLAMAAAGSAPTPEVQAVIAMQGAGMIPGHRRCACGAAYANPAPPTCLRCNTPMKGSANNMRPGVRGLGGSMVTPLTDAEKNDYMLRAAGLIWAKQVMDGKTTLGWLAWSRSEEGDGWRKREAFIILGLSSSNPPQAVKVYAEAKTAYLNIPGLSTAKTLDYGREARDYLRTQKAAVDKALADKRRAEQEAIDEAKRIEQAAVAEAAAKTAEAARAAERVHELAMAEQNAVIAQAAAEAAAIAAERQAAEDALARAEAEAEAAAIEAEGQAATLEAMDAAGAGESFFEKNKAMVIGGGVILALALLMPGSPITVIK